MSRERNTLADLRASYYPPPTNALNAFALPEHPVRNALLDLYKPAPQHNALWDLRPKTEYDPGYYRTVPNGLLGYRQEWVPGYWRRRAF